MERLFSTYRLLALVVGVLLAFCSFVAAPLKYLPADGSELQEFGESASILWMLHGWVFIAYVFVALLLARRAGWTPRFTVIVLVAGLVPLMIFFVERRVAESFRTEHPELTG